MANNRTSSFRSLGIRNLKSSGNSVAKFTGRAAGKTAVGLFKYAATDHLGLGDVLPFLTYQKKIIPKGYNLSSAIAFAHQLNYPAGDAGSKPVSYMRGCGVPQGGKGVVSADGVSMIVFHMRTGVWGVSGKSPQNKTAKQQHLTLTHRVVYRNTKNPVQGILSCTIF